jgi:hypothetical protein
MFAAISSFEAQKLAEMKRLGKTLAKDYLADILA